MQALKTSGAKAIATTSFKAEGSAANNDTISIRGNPMRSAKSTFASYVEDAVTQELTEAKTFNPTANTKISAVHLKNDISAAGFVTGSGVIFSSTILSMDAMDSRASEAARRSS